MENKVVVLENKVYFEELLAKGRAAQKEFEKFSQEDLDQAVKAIGKAVYDNAEELARMAVDETGMGNYEDKIMKNKGKPKAVWYKLKGVKSRGIVKYHDNEGLVDVAKPIGVIGCVTPTTNPTMTPVQNAMIALKGGNAVIISPHPRSKKTTAKTVHYMREALKEVGAPVDLIQNIDEPSLELSQMTMQMCDVCISTGGPAMVKSAYSSGKPAFGVGPGNVQCLVNKDADPEDYVAKVVRGRTYDNGVLCTCEQSLILPEKLYDETIEMLKEKGAHFIHESHEVDALRKTLFPEGRISPSMVGARPYDIAKAAGIEVPEDVKFLMVAIEKTGKDELLSKEKLAPVLAVYKYSGWKNAVDIAVTNLNNEGAGHSAVIHSDLKDDIEYASVLLPVSRIGIKMIGSSGLGGGFDNGLNPTATLGCGSWGNNSISENLWWNHLVNMSKIAYLMPENKIPTDDEIWN